MGCAPAIKWLDLNLPYGNIFFFNFDMTRGNDDLNIFLEQLDGAGLGGSVTI